MTPLFICLFLFVLSMPWIEHMYNRFIVNNSKYGTEQFEFTARIRDYYKMYGKVILLIFVIAMLLGIFSVLGKFLLAKALLPFFTFIIVVPAWVWIFAYMQAQKFNLRYDGMMLGENQFSCEVSTKSFMWLYLGNTLGIIFSAGLLIPWAKIRTIRYRLSCLTLTTLGDMNDFVNQKNDSSATAAELGNFFDIDIAL